MALKQEAELLKHKLRASVNTNSKSYNTAGSSHPSSPHLSTPAFQESSHFSHCLLFFFLTSSPLFLSLLSLYIAVYFCLRFLHAPSHLSFLIPHLLLHPCLSPLHPPGPRFVLPLAIRLTSDAATFSPLKCSGDTCFFAAVMSGTPSGPSTQAVFKIKN